MRGSFDVTNVSHAEPFAKIKLPAEGVVDEEIPCPFALDTPLEKQVSSVDDV